MKGLLRSCRARISLFLWMMALPLCFLLSSCGDKLRSAFTANEKVDFNFEVRPILVQKCYACHGPDPKSRKANLRLDNFEGATAPLKGGHRAVVPGNTDESALLSRIFSNDPDMIMPTPESHLTLSEEEKETLKKWIDQGAAYEIHWAFQKPETASEEEYPEAEIDRLVQKQIDKKGLHTVPKASKNALIRRVSYILTGLPPSPEAITRFEADKGDDAYEKMVDRYLHATGYGEVWARHWMDIVRYAETKGHEFDFTIQGAWRYRDYLIRAFNSDTPYDQLIREHLAGDLVKNIRRDPESGNNESIIGTTFFNLGEGAHSPVDVRKDEADRIDNVIDVTTKAFQGLTVACSRCHDHKFDPISTEDYYALFGVFESTRFSPRVAEKSRTREKDEQELKRLKNYIVTQVAQDWQKQPAPFTEEKQAPVAIQPASHTEYSMLGDFRGNQLAGWRSDGFAFGNTTTLGQPVFKDNKIIILQEGKASSKLFGTGKFGALRSPAFVIDKDFIGVQALGQNSTIRVIVDNYQLIRWPIYDNLDQEVNSDTWKNFTFNVRKWKGHHAYIEILPGRYADHVYKLAKNQYVEVKYAVAFDTKWPDVTPISFESASLAKSVDAWKTGQFSAGDIVVINEALKKKRLNNDFGFLSATLAKTSLMSDAIVDSTFFDGVTDGSAINSPVFVRGDHLQTSKNKVPRRYIKTIASSPAPFTSAGSGRLELAEAIVSTDNPLTARVMVNRIWYYLFGKGIVETVDNFGLQGKLPSNPALLDFLAVEFQRNGWSTRKLMKTILMTETFQRSTEIDMKNQERDSENIYLAGYPKRRLEAEMIRDGLLAAAGNLNTAMYGPSVPVHISSFMNGRGKPAKSGPLDGDGRRSVYQEVRRNFLDPTMTTFDRPIPFTTFGSRNVTTVPAQSLVLMNDPFVLHQAEIMAKKVSSLATPEFDRKIDWIFIRSFGRKASSQEINRARSFMDTLAKAEKIPPGQVGYDLNIWKQYCHTVFNVKEFIYLL